MVIGDSVAQRVLIGGLMVLVALPMAAAQTQDVAPSSPAAEKAAEKKDKPVAPPRRARESQRQDPGPGPKLDVPVSFPADI